MTPAEFQAETNVSRETLGRLQAFADLLTAWQKRINLVSANSLADLWRRHIFDSAQLDPIIRKAADGPIVDLGSGAGFPGLVLAILTGRETVMIESDQRKAAYLTEAARVTDAPARVLCQRIERAAVADVGPAAVITARACASLDALLEYARPFAGADTTLVFLKGESLNDELTEAGKNWTIAHTVYPSRSDPSGRILEVHDFGNSGSGT